MGSARSSFFRPSLRVVATLYFWWASKRKQGNLGKKFPANLEVCGQSFTKDICSYGSHEFISKRLHQNYISNQRNTFVVSTSKIGGLAHQKCTQSSSRRIGRKNEERAEAKSKSLYGERKSQQTAQKIRKSTPFSSRRRQKGRRTFFCLL